jgi:hypothetical protein
MEPVYMMLCHTAGFAAAPASKTGAAVQNLDFPALIAALSREGPVMHADQARKL